MSALNWQSVINKAKRESEFRIGNRRENGLAAVTINVIVKGNGEPVVYSVVSKQINPMEAAGDILTVLCQSVDVAIET